MLTAVARMAGPTMAVGFALPYWLRYAMILTGINWSEEMLIIRKVHISLLAKPEGRDSGEDSRLRSSSSEDSSFIAFRPNGVAAQPRPRILAMTLEAMYSSDGCPAGMSGNRKRMTGESRPDRRSIRPDAFAICIRPIQRDIIPSMVMQSVTASLEESSAAAPTSAMRPFSVPIRMDTMIMAPQR